MTKPFFLNLALCFGVLAMTSQVQAADPAPAIHDCPNCPEMVSVPAGKFSMGDDKSFLANEKPAHVVTFAKPFAIGKYEVTFAEWDACVADGGCTYKPSDQGFGRDKRPVTNVSYLDIQPYLTWLSKKTGKTYRLPTEAEWEYAARGGTTTAYPWGDAIGKGEANCTKCSDTDAGKTVPVGSFKPNGFGLYDVAGNVSEWVQDCYVFTYADAPTNGSAIEKPQCEERLMRGGSWHSEPNELRVTARNWYYPYNRVAYAGFRVARDE